jgi:hypothetical protein
MTEKEKAKYLVDTFLGILPNEYEFEYGNAVAIDRSKMKDTAKKCALVLLREMEERAGLVSAGLRDGHLRYCHNVKKEIEKI